MNAPVAISVIIPVLNEAADINGLIAHLRSLKSADHTEIIVVDGDPAGSTITTVRDPDVVVLAGERGRAAQMNAGASRADGDILLFLHADTLLPPDAFSAVLDAFRDREYVAGCFDLGIASPKWYFRVTERYVAWRTRITRIPFGDQAIFVRRDYFEQIGRYRAIPIMEDIELMRRIRGRGDVLCIIADRVMTSARRWEKEGVLCTTFRNWMLQLLYFVGVPPERLARFYQ